MYRVSLYNQGV